VLVVLSYKGGMTMCILMNDVFEDLTPTSGSSMLL
jgi:hypothetical protein